MAIEYGKSSDGLIVARVGDTGLYALRPVQDEFYIAYGSGRKPLEKLTSNDFYGHMGRIASEEAFKAEMEDIALSQEQISALGRYDVDSKINTPWGKSQGATVFVEKGIYRHHTASHGGFKVFKALNNEIPEPYRNDNGWYEEDCDWACVAVSLPGYFSEREVRQATETVINWLPDQYEAVTGEVFPEGTSMKKDERAFKERHADDWIVISAVSKTDDNGDKYVSCTASKGGERSRYEPDVGHIEVETAEFSVPSEEYKIGKFGFVIDPDRHPRLDEETPSMRM